MKYRLSLILVLAVSASGAASKSLAIRAVNGDAAAVQSLRAMGQPGVDALLAIRNETDAKRLGPVIDTVCRQRDCTWSGLYWYTDLEEAKRVARRTNRPILSLRLLGNLDEELSCANSRYFRTLLYPNREIRAFLRANYVLHWQSVRAAPTITIDFGGGRRMRRTITGNSIHYVLDAEGAVLDGIPGLYAPQAFLSLLREDAVLHRALMRFPTPEERFRKLAAYHGNVLYMARWTWRSPFDRSNEYENTRAQRMAAWTSGNMAPTKSGGGEATLLDRVSFDSRAFGLVSDLRHLLKDVVVGKKTIDDNARALIFAKRAASSDPAVRSRKSSEKAIENLERTLAADTKINEQRLHADIRRQLASGEAGGGVDAFNDWVYAEIFRAPNDDPWMGLVSDASFTGIIGEGLFVAQ